MSGFTLAKSTASDTKSQDSAFSQSRPCDAHARILRSGSVGLGQLSGREYTTSSSLRVGCCLRSGGVGVLAD